MEPELSEDSRRVMPLTVQMMWKIVSPKGWGIGDTCVHASKTGLRHIIA
jgi:hypothetical protein